MGVISQTTKAGSKAGAKAGAKAATKAIDEKNLSAIKAAGRKAHQEQASARAEKNAEIAEQLAKLPKRSKKASEEFGLYHPVGGGLKLSRPVSGLHATTVPDPMFNPPEIGFISPEQLVKEEAALFPLVGDRAAAGRYLTHVGEVELERPVRLTGGPLYMDANYNLIDPEQSAAWESGLGRVTALSRQAARAGEGGRPVYGIYTAGSATNTDFNIMGADALIQQLPYSKITKKAEKEFDRAMREGSKTFPPVPNWPGIRSPKAEEMLLDKSNGMLRTKLFDTMGKENFQSMGFPDVAATRKAIIQPELLDVDTHQTGFRLARMDTTGRTIENPLIPSDYPVAMAGQVAGQLDMPVDYKNIFQSHFDARRLLGQPESGDYYSFSRAHPIQYADEEWLNRLMEHRYQLERKIKEGRAEGGPVEAEYADLESLNLDDLMNPDIAFKERYPGQTRPLPSDLATEYNKARQDNRLKEALMRIMRELPQPVSPGLQALRNALQRRGVQPGDVQEAFGYSSEDPVMSSFAEGGLASPEGIPPIATDLEAEYRAYKVGGGARMQEGGEPPAQEQPVQPAPAISNDQIVNFITGVQERGGSDAEIAAAMDTYGVTPDQMAAALGTGVDVIQGRYNVATPQGKYSTAPTLGGVVLAGDSWLSEPDHASRLSEQLGGADVVNTAIGGSTSGDILDRLNTFIDQGGQFTPGTTVMMNIGGNDFLRGVDPEEVIANINQIASTLNDRGVQIILSAAPDVNSVADITGSTSLAVDPIYQQIVDANRNVTLVNSMADLLNQKNLVDESGFHLNQVGKNAFDASLAQAYRRAQGLGSFQLNDDVVRQYIEDNNLTIDQAKGIAPYFDLTSKDIDRIMGVRTFKGGGQVKSRPCDDFNRELGKMIDFHAKLGGLVKGYAGGGAVKMAEGGDTEEYREPIPDEIAYMAEALSPERESADSETAKKIRSAIKAGKVIATALPKALVSPVVGLYGTAKSGKYGTREGVVAGEKAMEEFMEPSEETIKELEADPLAMEYLQNTSKFMEELETKYKLPPLMPELYGVATGTRGIVPQVKELAKKGAAKAKEAVSEVPPLPAGLSIQPVGQTTEQWLKSLETPPKPSSSKMEVYAPANDLGLYSPLEKAALNLKRKEATGDVYLKDLKDAGVSDEELEFSGLKRMLMSSENVKLPKKTVQTWAKTQRIPFNVIRSREDANEHKFTFNLPEVIDDEKRIKADMDDIIADFEDIYPGGTEALRQEVMRNFSEAELKDPDILAEIEESVKANMRQEAYDRAYTAYYDNPDYRSYNDFGYEIVGNNDNGYVVKNPSGTPIKTDGRDYAIFNTMEEAQEAAVAHAKRYGILNEREPEFAKYQLPGGSNYQEFWIQVPSSGQRSFTKGHIDEDDIMFHTRTQDRKTLDGKRMLYVDELQSDWHQKGRDFGYYTKQDEQQYDALINQLAGLDRESRQIKEKQRDIERRLEPKIRQQIIDEHGFGVIGRNIDIPTAVIKEYLNKDPEYRNLNNQEYEIFKKRQAVNQEINKFANKVPDAPFKDKWHELGVKAMLHQAAEDGYERVGFSAAPAHIERWGTEAFAWEKVPEIKNDLEDFRQFVKQTMPESTDEAINLSFGDNKDRDYVYFKKNVIRPGGWRIVAKEQVGGDAGGINLEAEARARGLLKESSGDMVSSKEDLKRIVEATLRDPSEAKVERITNKVWNSMQKQDSGIHEPRKEGMKFFYDEALRKFLQKYAKKIGANYYESETKVGRGVSEDGGFVDKTEPVYVIEFTPKSKKSALIGQPFKKGGAVKMRNGGPIVSTYNTIPDINDAGAIKLAAYEQELKRYA